MDKTRIPTWQEFDESNPYITFGSSQVINDLGQSVHGQRSFWLSSWLWNSGNGLMKVIQI